MVDIYTTLAIFGIDQRNQATVSVDLTLSYLAAGKVGDQLRVVCECEKVGKTLAFTTAKIFAGDRILVTGQHTKYITEKALDIPISN